MSWLEWLGLRDAVEEPVELVEPEVETFRWGVDVQRVDATTYYVVTRSTMRDDGSWSYDRTIGLFKSREEAQAFVQAHIDLPNYAYTEHRRGDP